MNKIVLALMALALAGLVGAQTYSSSPVTGSMGGGEIDLEDDRCFDTEEEAEQSALTYGGGSVYESGSWYNREYCVDYDRDKWFEYKAGEFDVEAEGVLPPTGEEITITSKGTAGEENFAKTTNTYELWGETYTHTSYNCDGFDWDEDPDYRDDENWCTADIDRRGLYKVYANITLEAEGTNMHYPDDCLWDSDVECSYYYRKASMDASIKIDDDKGVQSWNDGDVNEDDDDGRRPDDDYKEFNLRGQKIGSISGPKEENFNVSAGNKSRNQTFIFDDSFRVGEMGQYACGYGYGDGGDYGCEWWVKDEKLYLKFNRNLVVDDSGIFMSDYIRADASYTINNYTVNFIFPNGNTHLDIDGRIFTANNTVNNNEVSTTVSPSDAGDWIDTSKSVSLDFDGDTDNRFDDVDKVVVEGDYYAASPPGVSPEGYRWVHRNTGEVLAEYTDLDSSDTGYRTLRREFRNSLENYTSGEYVLQVKSDANNYPVTIKQGDFKVKTDTYIEYGETQTFNPQFEIGNNNVEFYTTESNNLDYRVEWRECLEEDIVSGRSPGDDAFTSTTSPTLEVTTGCPSIDNVTFRDARTDTIVEQYEDVAGGTRLTADTDLSIGDTYRWYVRLCDQGECYDTDTWKFTVGRIDTVSEPKEIEELGGKGLKKNIRDEDFNALGEDTSESNSLHQGYVNKLEEESDQLEPGMGSAFYGMNETSDPITVGKWKDSVGTENRSDQWAITPHRNWTISNRGVPYPPWGTYYRSDNPPNKRTSASDPSIPQTEKVFGNSIAVVAQQDIYDDDGNLIAREGAGVWIDPDDLREWADSGGKYKHPASTAWYDILGVEQAPSGEVVGSKMDITGPDSGLGADDGSTNENTEPLNTEGTVLRGDIYFHGE